jgi:hypothetical protein
MGRLGQLKETLPANLRVLQGANVEFVLVDYNTRDGLEEWVRSSGVLEGELKGGNSLGRSELIAQALTTVIGQRKAS